MNFQQLRIIRETARRNFNLTEVANTLYTSQSGVSKHIKDLEDELGIELFIRKGKRLLGLTDPGLEMLKIVERMLIDAKNIKNLAEQYTQQDQGQLTLATTHTQARYALPKVVAEFKKIYPKVHLKLHQGSPDEIAKMLLEGEADIGIATETIGEISELAVFPYYSWHHAVIVPKQHPLVNSEPLTLAAIAEYPIITYHEGFTGRAMIEKTFQEAGFIPDIVMSALDADVIKSYVELGVGIGILASVAFNDVKDNELRRLGCDHLFHANTTKIAVRKGNFLRAFAYHFIEMCSPALKQNLVKEQVSPSDRF
ncbi:MAG: CysB family HTH-type transcriptional regulator [Pseudomonadota bacterium]